MPDRPPRANHFRAELEKMLEAVGSEGLPYLDVRAGDLHERVGGYPTANNRMPVCCSVMRSIMQAGDTVRDEPPGGAGANLVIRYRLPR